AAPSRPPSRAPAGASGGGSVSRTSPPTAERPAGPGGRPRGAVRTLNPGYLVLVVLYAWRLVSYRADIAGDLRNPARAFGFFTIVAGTDVLGTRLAADGQDLAAFALLA